MNKLFDLDSPIMRALSRIGDLMILNIMVIFCCVPIITAGAAFTGMHYVLLKIARGEEGYLVRGYFKSFKQNFRQATIIWLIMIAVFTLIIMDLIILSNNVMDSSRIYTILILAILIILLIISVYVFPILARFENPIKNTFRNAFFMSFLNLPKSILMLVLPVLPMVVAYFWPYSFIFVILFGISAPAYASAYLYSGIFKKYEPKPQEPVSDYDFSITSNNGNGEEE